MGTRTWKKSCSLAAAAAGLTLGASLLTSLGGCASSGHRGWVDPVAERRQEAKALAEATDLVRQAQRDELKDDTDAAMAKYQRAIATYHDMWVAWNNLGNLLFAKEEMLQAAEAFKTASELAPTDPRPVYNLGAIWDRLGYRNTAAQWYDQAIARDRRYLPALRRRIMIDAINDESDDQTFKRIRQALLLEHDPFWINYFRRVELRLRELAPSTSEVSFPTVKPARRFDAEELSSPGGQAGTAPAPAPVPVAPAAGSETGATSK